MPYVNGQWAEVDEATKLARERPPRTYAQILADQNEDAFIRRAMPSYQRPAACRDGCDHTRLEHYELAYAERPRLDAARAQARTVGARG